MSKFKDIKGHWCEDTINTLAEMGIIHGEDNEKFEPILNVLKLKLLL